MSLRDELLALLREAEVDLPADAGHGTSLLRPGRVDSLALFRLASWVERAVGECVDPASFDLAKERETVGDVVRSSSVAAPRDEPRDRPLPSRAQARGGAAHGSDVEP